MTGRTLTDCNTAAPVLGRARPYNKTVSSLDDFDTINYFDCRTSAPTHTQHR